MSTHQRQLNLPHDLPPALKLADVSALSIPHVADWPYRFSSWALDHLQNTQVWMDAFSQPLGWAVLQTPFWAIDCVVRPDAPPRLYQEMLGWAQARAAEMNAQGEGRPIWFVSISAACLDQRRDLTALGFEDVSEASENPWSKVLFELAGDGAHLPAQLPEGLRVRSLDISSEIQAYVAMHREVFQSESMTPGWRSKVTHMPDYINELDLVISSDNGGLYGFCVAWLRQLVTGETVGQIEPLGVRESHRGQKFSQALLAEAIRRLRNLGASRVYVETDKQRAAAMEAYRSMGFRVAHDVLVYRYVVPGR
jgi:ribosomal protein S18 acetylase RimI-like enzyme